MPTIEEYTDQKQLEILYPHSIISPSHSRPCCFSHMEEIGDLQRERN